MSNIIKNRMKLSLIIPAYNEEMNIVLSLYTLLKTLRIERIPFEIIVVNDNCRDNTSQLVEEVQKNAKEIFLVNRTLPRGFGRAIRDGLKHAKGDVIIPVMADMSEDPRDVVRYYRKIEDGYDSVFGSRFTTGSKVTDYPRVKFIVNRLVNRMLQLLFFTRHNDLTNAFKAYRAHVIDDIMPLQGCHFNITIEISLSVLIRKYKIASMPINWNGRMWGSSELRLREMGRRYLATLLKIWFERMLIMDDLMADRNKKSDTQ
ncbi:glycosyltransferase family 2 protein [Thermodesulfobacteriota bacterium]